MIHCIVAERKQEHLWSWLSIHYTPKYMQSWTPFEMRAWRANVLRWLVESASYWAPGGADLRQGLLTYADACERFDGASHVPKGAARTWLLKKVSSVDTRSIPRDVFDHFLSLAVDGKGSQFERARALLAYPGQPRPDEGLEVLRSRKDRQLMHPQFLNFLETHYRPSLTCFYHFVLDVARALHRQGRTGEAREALDIGRDLAPSYFRGVIPKIDWKVRERQSYKRHVNNTSQHGFEFDGHGSMIESKFRRQRAEARHKIDALDRQREAYLARQKGL